MSLDQDVEFCPECGGEIVETEYNNMVFDRDEGFVEWEKVKCGECDSSFRITKLPY